jgi:hypothetical protein
VRLVAQSERVHRSLDHGHRWPTGRSGARAPAVGRAACGAATTITLKSFGRCATRLRRSSERRTSRARSEARPGVGLLRSAGVLTIAEADGRSSVAGLRPASYVFARSLALGVRPSTRELLEELVGLLAAVSVSHRGWGKRYYWPTGRAAARAPAVAPPVGEPLRSRSSRWVAAPRACAGRRCAGASPPERGAAGIWPPR